MPIAFMRKNSSRRNRGVSPASLLLGTLCLTHAGCASVPAKPAAPKQHTQPDATGAGSPEELVVAVDESCKHSDLATLVTLLHPDERPDLAAGLLFVESMQCFMLSMASALSRGSDVNVEGLSANEADCKSMAEVAARYGAPFELWHGALTGASEQEKQASFTKARKALDSVDVPRLMRELLDAKVKPHASASFDFPGKGKGVDRSALRVEGDTARVPVRGATGSFTLVRVGRRWFLSMARSKPGESAEQVASREREQAIAADQEALRAAVHGTWTGPWGRVDFRPDGTAKLEIRSCASKEERPWQLRPGSCAPEVSEGTVELAPYEIGISRGDVTDLYNAYVDAAGRLHFADSWADVGKLDGQRKGQVKLSMTHTLHILGDSCRLEDSMENTNEPITCAFVKEAGVDALRVDVAMLNGTSPTWLVYLPEQGLLVPPEVYASSFEREAAK